MAESNENAKTPTSSANALPPAAPKRATDHWAWDVGSLALGAGAGYYAADVGIRSAIFKNLAQQGVFDEMRKGRDQEYKQLLKQAQKEPYLDVAKGISALEERYRYQVKHKVESLGLFNLKDYWNCLKRNQRLDIGVTVATVSGIAIGALFMLGENKALQGLLSGGVNNDEAPAR